MKTLILQRQSSEKFNLRYLKEKYHYIIKDGQLIEGLNEMTHGTHTPGYNYNTIGVLIIDPRNLNKANRDVLKKLIKDRDVMTFDKSLQKYIEKSK